MTSDFVVPKDSGALVRLRISPNAKSTELRGPYGDSALKPGVAAPSVDGKANAEIGRFLAGPVGAASSGVRVVRGRVGGVGAEKVREALSPHRR